MRKRHIKIRGLMLATVVSAAVAGARDSAGDCCVGHRRAVSRRRPWS